MVGKHKYQQRTMSEEAYLLRREIDGESDRARITAITDAHRPVWSHQ